MPALTRKWIIALLPFVLFCLGLYYVMPYLVQGHIMALVFVVNPLCLLFAGALYGIFYGFKWHTMIVLPLLFVPTAFFIYGFPGMVLYVLFYFVATSLGLAVGALAPALRRRARFRSNTRPRVHPEQPGEPESGDRSENSGHTQRSRAFKKAIKTLIVPLVAAAVLLYALAADSVYDVSGLLEPVSLLYIVFPTGLASLAIVYSILHGFRWYYSVLMVVLFVPSCIIFFRLYVAAWMFYLSYSLCVLGGQGIGALIRYDLK
ncbi:MAG: hypothetical protein FWF71_07485 [Actinomycetia bacterium]|nr:hypothetical protein [Actinomycetes bacterium]